MTIVICDDNLSETQHITKLINAYNSKFRLITHTKAQDTLAYLKMHPSVDLCILDIIMPELSGIELAQALRNTGYAGEIIFLTSSNHYACESYEVKALQYILKPYTKEKLFQALHAAEEKKLAEDNTGILIKTQDETRFVPHREIIYAEAQLRKVILHLNGGQSVPFHARFNDITKQLQTDSRFIRCHRSYIVNMDYISSIVGKVIELRGGPHLAISSTYTEVKRAYMHFVLGDENG